MCSGAVLKPANDSGLARIQVCPNSHVSKTSDNCDIGVFVLILEVSFRNFNESNQLTLNLYVASFSDTLYTL